MREDGIGHSVFPFIIGCTSALEKRTARALFSQLSLACQPVLTEGGNVDFVSGKFRSDNSGTSMRSICVVSVNKRLDVPCDDIQRFFFFLVSTALRDVLAECAKPARVK